MKKLISLLCLALAMTASMQAQSVDTEYTAEMNKMLEAMHTKELMVKTVALGWESMKLPLTDYTAASKAMVDDLWTDLVQDYVNEYKKHFTIEEIRELNKFYSTPVGQKMGEYSIEMSTNIQTLMGSKYTTRMQDVIMKYIKQ